jgi:hypothetical protein
MIDRLGQRVTLKVRDGDTTHSYVVKAHVSQWREQDLIAGGSIETGDLRLIIEDVPHAVGQLTQKDRVEIDGRTYAIMTWDMYTRKMGDNQIAVEASVRG